MRRSGSVLVLVMITVTLGSMVAASLLFRMRAAVGSSTAVANGEQAYSAAMSAINRAITVLQTSPDSLESWYNNPDLFRNQIVCNDGTNIWYFTVYASDPTDPTVVRYGLIDESAKININVAGEQSLRSLPNMTDELLDCLLDYRDDDDTLRPHGAEQVFYDRLPQPYLIKNGDLATVEELLLVKNFTASLVYGEDINLNGLLDKNEDDGAESFPPDDSDGQLNGGLLGMTTTVTYDPALDTTGRPRININGKLESLAETQLPPQTIEFITLYRAEKKLFAHPTQLLEMRYQLSKDHTKDGRMTGDWIDSGIKAAELPIVCDQLIARKKEDRKPLRGLINVNTASAEVLGSLPGIDEHLASSIVNARVGLDDQSKSTIAWVYTEGLLEAGTFKRIAPLLTARSYQYRLRCVGFGSPCGRFRIIEAVIDIGREIPRVLYLRDLTRLGMPLMVNLDRQETLRS